MDNLFLTILSMSGTAAIIILLVLLTRLVLRRTPKVYSYALWAVVLFRLLCPFAIPAPWSLTPTFHLESASEDTDLVTVDFTRMQMTVRVDSLSPDRAYIPPKPSNAPSSPDPSTPVQPIRLAPSPLSIAGTIWLAGVVILLGYSAVSLLLLRRKLVGCISLEGEENVRLADHIPSPFVLGLARPKVYLPSGLPEGERDYILLHERTHICRGDHIFRALAWLALSIHWFNPLVWAAFHLAGKDMEMSCDEAVLRKMGPDVRADYSSSLLRLSTGGTKLPAGPLAFGGGDPKGRIKNVLNYKKPALWVMVIALIAVLAAGIALSTSRSANYPGDDPQEELPQDAQPASLASGANSILFDDLTLTIDQLKGSPFVRISGSADGVPLSRAIWNPEDSDALFGDHPGGYLSMEYEFSSGWASITAWWEDEARTAVTVSTLMSAMLSSYGDVGYWEFTVADPPNHSPITHMAAYPRWNILEEGETLMCPESITYEESVHLARIAAQLMEYAEDYYAHNPPANQVDALVSDVSGLSPVYSINNTQNGVAIGGLDCSAAAWLPLFSAHMDDRIGLPPEGTLGYLSIENPRFLGANFAQACGHLLALYYPDQDDGPLIFVEFDDWTNAVYAPSAFCFTINLASNKIEYRDIPGNDLNDQTMLKTAQVLAVLIQNSSDYYAIASNPPPEEGPLPFDQPLGLWFGSGAGAWRTILTLHPDGTFEGDYTDSDMGSSGEGYPMGTAYICAFHGRFGNIRQASAGSWSMTLESLTLDTGHPLGEEWIAEHRRYISSAPYGLDGSGGQPLEPGAQFVLYTPDASAQRPRTELFGMEDESSELYQFWTWWPHRANKSGSGTPLGCYALRSVETGYGFFDLREWGIAE